MYDLAVHHGFAVISGTGYRRGRKGSPLLNTLRQRADALAQPLVWVERGGARGGVRAASCTIDFSPLRYETRNAYEPIFTAACAAAHGALGERAPLIDSMLPEVATLEEVRDEPIWALPPVLVRFGAPDGQAAKRLAAVLCELRSDGPEE